MPQSHPNRQLWRDVTLFDGERTYDAPMAVITDNDRIERVCRMNELSDADIADLPVAGQGGVLTPGLIDCHTHLVFGGQRAGEFEQRLEGASYADIAAQGGGIISTVRATREASEDDLYTSAAKRLQGLMADGVTTVEIKSGYGLTTEHEAKMLRVARRLGEQYPVRVVTTFLGAHALPPEYKDRKDDYIDLVCNDMIPSIADQGLADAVDVFCEGIAFNLDQTERVFQAAHKHGLPIKGHVEQLSHLGGASLAAKYNALSVDHIEWLTEDDVQAIAESGTVATLLPGAFYTLRDTQVPPIDALRRARVPMAIATDGNPGSSPIFQLTLILNMACTLFRLTPTEALQGVTANAARALGLSEQLGSIQPGQRADFCIWDIEQPAELAYAIAPGRLRQRVFDGVITHANDQ
ncbi:imidazolonepropionase [Saccharospirillum salsuginis]|uniref:Imidazolonepropionase n=1 Tax=Saccharospirillum salsuginis TaxID=418750 RepID=A0A918JZS8_9GAMM|nr:imidazolonepropionase [Saccharospirillum salsuginis]GGX39181.1 imidazolonepropionase [Saccharospirillum salsuginis]